MEEFLSRRCLETARYMLENHATVRQTAAALGQSKSAVHKNMCKMLPKIDPVLAKPVAALLEYNKSVRHLRGGEATKRRYQGLQSSPNAL